MNPYTPKLEAQIKFHKANMPIRPVINNMTVPIYTTSKTLRLNANN